MGFLLDENVPNSFIKTLKQAGCKVEHINKVCKGMADKQVLEYALKNKYCLISFDYDFCGLKKNKHYGIVKFSSLINDLNKALLNLLKYLKVNEVEDVYYQLDRSSAYKEIKILGKKKPYVFKNFSRIPLTFDYFEEVDLKSKKLKRA